MSGHIGLGQSEPEYAGPDPLEQEIEAVLDPGGFVSDRACFSFVSELEETADKIDRLTAAEADRAAALYEAFLAGCFEKAEEVDDSSGSFGMFVGDLFCGWVKARQAASADSVQTAARLLGWMDSDPYGLCSGLEKNVADVLDSAGLDALVEQVRARFDGHVPPGGQSRDLGAYKRFRWGEALRALHAAQQDIEAYVRLAEDTGLTARDCHAVATMLAARDQREEAVSWAERGLEIDAGRPARSMACHELSDLKRELLRQLGRAQEAVDSAWADFSEHPSTYSYRDLMKFVPMPDRTAWHERAIETALARASLYPLIELLAETGEASRLAELVGRSSDRELEQVSHYALEPAARMLEQAHAGRAARLWRAMGIRIVSAGKSRYYEAALENFERAKRCYATAGLTTDWEQVVSQVRADHRRKAGFMPRFEQVVSGSAPEQEPPFLERAKARWAPGPTPSA